MHSVYSTANEVDTEYTWSLQEIMRASIFGKFFLLPPFLREYVTRIVTYSIGASIVFIRYWINYIAVPFSNLYNRTHISSDGVRSNSGVEFDWNLQYGDIAGEWMDILSPTGEYESSGRNILYVHGGGFVAVHRGVLHHSMTPLVRAGFTVFSMDYPLAPEFKYPVPIVSVLKCLAYLSSEKGVEQVTLLGDSAGGALVSVVAAVLLNRGRGWHPDIEATLARLHFPEIENVALLYSICDLEAWKCYKTWSSLVQTMIVSYCVSQYRNSDDDRLSVMDNIEKIAAYPRTLLLCGSMDPLQRSHDVFHAALKEIEADSTHLVVPGFHGFHGLPAPFSLGLWRTTTCPANCGLIKWLCHGDESRVPVLPRIKFFEEFNFSLLLLLAGLHALTALALTHFLL